jgi:DNA-binding NtrC family response regulator
MLADLRPTNGAIAEVLVASAGSGPELHQALTVAAQDAGVLWLRDLAAAAADRVPVIEQLLSQRSGGPRVVATAERLEDVPEALRKRFDDTVVLPGQLDAEDVAWHLGRGLVKRLTEVDRVELVDRDPGWMLSATLERLLTVPWKGDSRDVGNLARRLALESPDTAMEIPVQSAEGVLSDADLLVALESQAYRISATARSLSMSPNTLRKRMSSMGLPSASDLQTADIEAASAQTGGDVEEMARMLRVSAQGLRLRMSRTS